MEATPNDTGVVIEVDGRRVAVFNIHPDDYPYQPFQLLDIPYYGQPGLDTAEQAVRAAQATRGKPCACCWRTSKAPPAPTPR